MTMHSDTPNLTGRRGFTLLELLVVIAIISILLAIVLVAGSVVSSRAKVRATTQVLTSLDRALDEFIIVAGTIPVYSPQFYDGVPGPDNQLITGYDSLDHSARPDAAVFIQQATGRGEADAIIGGIPDRFLQSTVGGPTDDIRSQWTAPSVLDAWANESWPDGEDGSPWPVKAQQIIYFVHPQNTLAQDLYGRCVNGRPYFMSAGPDRKYGLTAEISATSDDVTMAESFVEDNLYSYQPTEFKRGMSDVFRKGER